MGYSPWGRKESDTMEATQCTPHKGSQKPSVALVASVQPVSRGYPGRQRGPPGSISPLSHAGQGTSAESWCGESPALTTIFVGLRNSRREVAAFVAPPQGELKPRTPSPVQAELSWGSEGEEDSLSREGHSGALGNRSKLMCIPE